MPGGRWGLCLGGQPPSSTCARMSSSLSSGFLSIDSSALGLQNVNALPLTLTARCIAWCYSHNELGTHIHQNDQNGSFTKTNEISWWICSQHRFKKLDMQNLNLLTKSAAPQIFFIVVRVLDEHSLVNGKHSEEISKAEKNNIFSFVAVQERF